MFPFPRLGSLGISRGEDEMPYVFGEGDEGWDDYMERTETEDLQRAPADMFQYVEPCEAQTSVLRFSREPKPPADPDASEEGGKSGGIFGWLFGPRARQEAPPSPRAQPEIGSAEWTKNYEKEQQQEAAQALYRVAVAAAALRSHGVNKVFVSYDGGNDEGFARLESLELGGRQVTRSDPEAKAAINAASVAACGREADADMFERFGDVEFADDAAIAFVGPGFGTGPYEMVGAIIIDCEACTLTDVKDRHEIFAPDNGPH